MWIRTSPRELYAFIVFAAACAAFAIGAGFDLDGFDSAELALVAVTGGLGHPPGQPLHTALGWLITRAPFVRPLAALAWLSIVPAALALALAIRRGITEAKAPVIPIGRGATLVGVALLACVLGPVRDVACRIEVYPLAAALSFGAILISTRRDERSDALTGLLLGLALATNPWVATQGAGAAYLAARERGRMRTATIARLTAGVFAGLLVYGYAWAVAPRETTTIVWGAPDNASSFVAMLTAHAAVQNFTLSWLLDIPHLVWDMARNGMLTYVALGAWGLADRFGSTGETATFDERAQRSALLIPLGIALVIGVLTAAASAPYRAANPDTGGAFLVPVFIACAGVARLAASVRGLSVAAALVALTAVLAVPATVARGLPGHAARALATDVLEHAPRRAIAVLRSEHLLFPALYLQRVEGMRPDVTILNPAWSGSEWAWHYASAHDGALRLVDARGANSGFPDLLRTLRARGHGRAVLAEWIGFLHQLGPEVCARGLVWTSIEGCDGADGQTDRSIALVHALTSHVSPRSWDARLAMFTARSQGDQALTIGCRGLALRYYSAGLRDAVQPAVPSCDGRRATLEPPVDVLEITLDDVQRALDNCR